MEVVAEASSLEAFSPVALSQPIDLLIVSEEFLRSNTADLVCYLNPPAKAPRLLVIATTDQAQLINEAAARGVPGFIMQQSNLQTLVEAVEAVLQGRTYYCQVAARLLAENLVSKGALQAPRLTPREQAVLRGYASGENTKTMAGRLGLSVKTIQNHLTNLKDKLGRHEPADLIWFALEQGYITSPGMAPLEPIADSSPAEV